MLSSMVTADIPAWPDFSMRWLGFQGGPIGGFEGCWIAETNTGRPGNPIFRVSMPADAAMPESVARSLVLEEMQLTYKRVHPNGCPQV
jgi:hypothetical protein